MRQMAQRMDAFNAQELTNVAWYCIGFPRSRIASASCVATVAALLVGWLQFFFSPWEPLGQARHLVFATLRSCARSLSRRSAGCSSSGRMGWPMLRGHLPRWG
jgi:hypothetical protein